MYNDTRIFIFYTNSLENQKLHYVAKHYFLFLNTHGSFINLHKKCSLIKR
jgi:hypothetical protein